MSSIAIIVLEGKEAIIDTSERTHQAEADALLKGPKGSTEYRAAFYESLYAPERLALDHLVPGADAALAKLTRRYDSLLLISARPKTLEEETRQWLRDHRVWSKPCALRLKDYSPGEASERFIPNDQWKTSIVSEVCTTHNEIFFIDATGKDRKAVALNLPMVRTAARLQEALTP